MLTVTIGKDWKGAQTVVIKASGSGSSGSGNGGVTAKPADEQTCVSERSAGRREVRNPKPPGAVHRREDERHPHSTSAPSPRAAAAPRR